MAEKVLSDLLQIFPQVVGYLPEIAQHSHSYVEMLFDELSENVEEGTRLQKKPRFNVFNS